MNYGGFENLMKCLVGESRDREAVSSQRKINNRNCGYGGNESDYWKEGVVNRGS